MLKKGLLFALTVSALIAVAQVRPTSPLKPTASIPLPSLHDGDFDHFAFDPQTGRLFLTAEANGQVDVFDSQHNKLIHVVTGLKEPHSMLYRADLHRFFVVDGGASEVKMYDSEDYRLLGAVKLSIDADSLTYDPQTKYLYVVNGGREAHTPYSFISIVDTDKFTKVADVKIDSNWLEGMALESTGRRLFFNDTGKNRVGVLDRDTHQIIANWPIPADTQENSPMKFDEANHRLFIATRKSPKFIVIDSDNGKVVSSVDCVPMVDDIAFDAKSKRIYLSGSQLIDVFAQKDADHYSRIGHAVGAFRAKTAILVPEQGRYYLAVPRHGRSTAMVKVYNVAP